MIKKTIINSSEVIKSKIIYKQYEVNNIYGLQRVGKLFLIVYFCKAIVKVNLYNNK